MSPSFVEPMKALPVEKLPEGDWIYEIKHDGYRALCFKDGEDVRPTSRNGNAFDYPRLIEALTKLPAQRAILDGEVAALDEKGRSSFQLLRSGSSCEVCCGGAERMSFAPHPTPQPRVHR